MKQFILSGFVLSVLFSSIAYADESKPFNIVNHFDKSLNYTITINPQVLPNLPTNFSIPSQGSVQANILDEGKEAYIRVVDDVTPKPNSAFWGINIENNKIKFHGYIGKGIAYSWKDQTITFCTPEEYKKNHHC